MKKALIIANAKKFISKTDLGVLGVMALIVAIFPNLSPNIQLKSSTKSATVEDFNMEVEKLSSNKIALHLTAKLDFKNYSLKAGHVNNINVTFRGLNPQIDANPDRITYEIIRIDKKKISFLSKERIQIEIVFYYKDQLVMDKNGKVIISFIDNEGNLIYSSETGSVGVLYFGTEI